MGKIVLTNMTDEHIEALKKEAASKGMTVTGRVKMWCQQLIDKERYGKGEGKKQ